MTAWTVTATWRTPGLDGLTVDGGTTSRHATREEATAARMRLEGRVGVPTDATDLEVTVQPPRGPAGDPQLSDRTIATGRAGIAQARAALAGARGQRGAA